jgi:hypothetical protein
MTDFLSHFPHHFYCAVLENDLNDCCFLYRWAQFGPRVTPGKCPFTPNVSRLNLSIAGCPSMTSPLSLWNFSRKASHPVLTQHFSHLLSTSRIYSALLAFTQHFSFFLTKRNAACNDDDDDDDDETASSYHCCYRLCAGRAYHFRCDNAE